WCSRSPQWERSGRRPIAWSAPCGGDAGAREQSRGTAHGGRVRPRERVRRAWPVALRSRLARPPMSVFADSSAVVKLYADESGSTDIRSLEAMYVSQLCRVEVPSALWRKSRLGELAAENARILVTA